MIITAQIKPQAQSGEGRPAQADLLKTKTSQPRQAVGRWRVERPFAWLHHFRRLVIRWEYHVENFFGMVRLGCMQILLRHS